MTMLSMTTTTEDVIFAGRPRPGVPIVLRDGLLEPDASLYLLEGAVHQRLSPRSQRTYAEALIAWLRWLDAHSLPWRDVVLADAVAFVDAIAGRSTAALRGSVVASFYAWAWRRGRIPARPFRTTARHPRAAAAAASASVDPTPILTLPTRHRRERRFLLPGHYHILRTHLPLHDADLHARIDLALGYGWETGLRISEVVALTTTQILRALAPADPFARRLPPLPADPLASFDAAPDCAFAVTLDPAHTKGGVGGEILVPRLLMRRTLEWIVGGRADLLRRAAQPGRRAAHADRLFLTDDATPLNVDTLAWYLWRASRDAGLAVGFHALRHSFAERFAVAAERHGLQRWPAVLQELLHQRDPDSQRAYLSGLADPAMRHAARLIAARLAEE